MLDKLENVLGPIAEKLNNNKVLIAIRDGFLISTPLIIGASVFLLIQNFPINGYSEFMASIFGENWSTYLGAVSGATFSLLAMINVICIGYVYARELGSEGMVGGIVALVSFLILTPQSHPNFVNDAGKSFSGFAYSNLGSSGLFLGMICAIVSVLIFNKIEKKGWVIKMPAGVPPMVAMSFSALIPAFFSMTFFFLLRIGVSLTSYNFAHDMIMEVLQAPLMGLGRLPIFPVLYQFFSTLFWFFGINGPAVTNTVFSPITTVLTQENLSVFLEFGMKADLPNIYTASFSDFFGNYGGGGSTLSLVICMLFFAKSQRLKQLGRLSIVPGIFGVNEMVIFGLPVVLNPIILVPFILVPVMNISLGYIATAIGLIPRTFGISIPWTMPIFFSGWLATGSFKAAFFQIFLLILGILVYYPFFKVLDKQYLEEETKGLESETDELDDISLSDISFD
ncbi:PTS sugar transporter subunit IIA [Erysipelothrix larvae]|uniref:Permease IIC component n=1 Tax=Erysipelothrix larvae TaxID=1514105 RepID=A0A0X8H0T6_9FIRM|nr:PTS transporter subunit EIIC [Erysipelothrix larvae]AMC93951.1 PTS sugar transporter subunit IIA [Erysipelothrix larvae]